MDDQESKASRRQSASGARRLYRTYPDITQTPGRSIRRGDVAMGRPANANRQSDGADLGADDWNLLGLWDADIIYSYVNLDGALHRRLAHRLAPSKIFIHPREDWDRLLPSLAEDSSFLSSVSVVPLLAKWRSFRGQAIPEVLDKERHVGAPRDLADGRAPSWQVAALFGHVRSVYSFGFAVNDAALRAVRKSSILRMPSQGEIAVL